jgi:hypothetical protein
MKGGEWLLTASEVLADIGPFWMTAFARMLPLLAHSAARTAFRLGWLPACKTEDSQLDCSAACNI